MTVKDLLRNGQNSAAPVSIVITGEAEISEPGYSGNRSGALKSRYAEHDVAAWEAVYNSTLDRVGIFIYIEEKGRTF